MLTGAQIASRISPDSHFADLSGSFELENGDVLDGVSLAYRTWGQLAEHGRNAVLICHALTGSADADDWWPGLIGAGSALDPNEDFVICSNVIGSCYGSTGPLSLGADGTRHGGAFPQVSIRDMVRAQYALLEQLGVKRLRLVIGPSLGGMQTLEWAAMYPDFVDAIVPIGVSGRHSAWCIATSEAQRQAIFADPDWRDGFYTADRPPRRGLAAARIMAMVSYRSWQNFESRFGRERQDDAATDVFQVQSYLRHQGSKINQRFDAVSYVRLTEAMDTHDLARGRGEYGDVLRQITQPALIMAVASDILYPPHEQRLLADHLPGAEYTELDSEHGHDGFLIETAALSAAVRGWRAGLSPAGGVAALP
ncbi:MAG: homoserine O-acetyltransferase [Pseudomonadota bacterium]